MCPQPTWLPKSYSLIHTYTDLPTAVFAASQDDVLTLIAEISKLGGKENSSLSVSNRHLTIDLNGHTIGGTDPLKLTNNAVVTFLDSSEGTPGGWYNCVFTADSTSQIILRNLRTNTTDILPLGYGQLSVADGYIAAYINENKSYDAQNLKLIVREGTEQEFADIAAAAAVAFWQLCR